MTEHDKALIREALLMGLDSARTEAGEAIRMYGSYPKDGPGGRKVENAERVVRLFDDALVAVAEVQTLPQDREALMYRLRRMSVALRHRPIPLVDVILLMRQAATALEVLAVQADSLDAVRYRWLCEDLPSSAERGARAALLERMSAMGKGAIDSAIDSVLRSPQTDEGTKE